MFVITDSQWGLRRRSAGLGLHAPVVAGGAMPLGSRRPAGQRLAGPGGQIRVLGAPAATGASQGPCVGGRGLWPTGPG
jgi:hypothetical protein